MNISREWRSDLKKKKDKKKFSALKQKHMNAYAWIVLELSIGVQWSQLVQKVNYSKKKRNTKVKGLLVFI